MRLRAPIPLRLTAALLLLAGGEAASAQLVRCESIAGRYQTCRTPTANGVSLARQLGGSACTFGKSWGWDAGGIWVKENCRGDFRLRRDRSIQESAFTCDSDHAQVERCAADTRAGVVIDPEASTPNCEPGQSWGVDIGSVWVSKRCTATFSIGAVELGRAIVCTSPEKRRILCQLDTDGGVTLEAEEAPGSCVYGTTWGLDENGVWSEPACRGTFRADGRLRGTSRWSEPDTLACESLDGRRVRCPVDTTRGVLLAQETSAGVCRKGQTWGADAHGIWVVDGCRALFRLGR